MPGANSPSDSFQKACPTRIRRPGSAVAFLKPVDAVSIAKIITDLPCQCSLMLPQTPGLLRARPSRRLSSPDADSYDVYVKRPAQFPWPLYQKRVAAVHCLPTAVFDRVSAASAIHHRVRDVLRVRWRPGQAGKWGDPPPRSWPLLGCTAGSNRTGKRFFPASTNEERHRTPAGHVWEKASSRLLEDCLFRNIQILSDPAWLRTDLLAMN